MIENFLESAVVLFGYRSHNDEKLTRLQWVTRGVEIEYCDQST